MKRLPKGTKAQIMGTRLFQTMYTADQMRKAVADELEAAEERVVDLFANMETPYLPDIIRAIRARGNT